MSGRFRMTDKKTGKVEARNFRIVHEEDQEEFDEDGSQYTSIFIEAICDVFVQFGDHSIIQQIRSPGIGSVNSNDEGGIRIYDKEEMESLKDILKTMGIEVKA